MRSPRTAACVLWLLVTVTTVQASEKTGLSLGVKAPVFALKDQNGKERSLDELLKQGKAALVFYRSASW